MCPQRIFRFHPFLVRDGTVTSKPASPSGQMMAAPRRACQASCRRGKADVSRAVNIDATADQVMAMSAKHNAAISAIEPLLPQGTRVVLQNADDAAVVARAFGSRALTGTVTREPWRQRRIN